MIDKKNTLSRMVLAGFPTQAAFADALGMRPSTLTNILNGSRRLQIDEEQRMTTLLGSPVLVEKHIGCVAEAVAKFIERVPKEEWDKLHGRFEVAALIRREFC